MGAEDTKRRIILAAEQLFAARGIDDVSMREITEAAGQKNASALNYHFGGRHALVQAIFAYRMGALNARRIELIDEVEAQGRQNDLHVLMALLVQPLADQILDPAGDNYYLSFFSQVIANPDIAYRELVSGKYDQALVRTNHHIIKMMAHMPENTVRQRLTVITATAIHALCDFQRHMKPGEVDQMQRDLDRFVGNLIDMLVGALTAPITAYKPFSREYTTINYNNSRMG